MIRMRDVEFSDQSHQERLHLDDPIQRAVLSVPGSEKYKIRSTYANRHPRQPLTPPENVQLGEQEVNTQRPHRNTIHDRTGSHTPQRVIPLVRPF